MSGRPGENQDKGEDQDLFLSVYKKASCRILANQWPCQSLPRRPVVACSIMTVPISGHAGVFREGQ